MRAIVFYRNVSDQHNERIEISGVTFIDNDGNPIDEYTGMPAEFGLQQIDKDGIHDVQFEAV